MRSPGVLIAAIVVDAVVLTAFVAVRARQDPFVVAVAAGGIAAIFALEALYLRRRTADRDESDDAHREH